MMPIIAPCEMSGLTTSSPVDREHVYECLSLRGLTLNGSKYRLSGCDDAVRDDQADTKDGHKGQESSQCLAALHQVPQISRSRFQI